MKGIATMEKKNWRFLKNIKIEQPFVVVGYSAAAAKSLQLCLTLCNLIDGSSPGSPIPGILQARTLEWVAISFSNAWKWKVKVKSLSHVRLSDPMDYSPPGSPVHGIFKARVAFHFSFFRITCWSINLDYCDTEWFALETNRDLSVIFDIASNYCISHCGGMGQKWPAAGPGALGAADLGHTACGLALLK